MSGFIYRPQTILMSKSQWLDLKTSMGVVMDVAGATMIGWDRGRRFAAAVCTESFVNMGAKDAAGCGCPRGVDDICCHECLRAVINAAHNASRRDVDFIENVARLLDAGGRDASEHTSVLWDAFEAGFSQAVDDVLERMVPVDKLMTMAQRAAKL